MNIGIIPCSNGLGHISRSIKLANILIKNYNVTLFLSKKKNFPIDKKIIIKTVKPNFYFSKKNNYNFNWYKNINKRSIKEIDLIISDNLPEVILLNKKTIIFANFFWHEIFNNKNLFFKKLKKIIVKKKIRIISNYLFGNISSYRKNILKIGFLGKYKGKNTSKKKGILISTGTSNFGYKKNLNLHLKMLFSKKFRQYDFYIDKKLLKNQKILTSNIKIADFSENMFDKIKVAIIKPGFGSIHECLERGIPIISYLERVEKEFIYNAKILKKKKIGNYFFNFKDALEDSISKFNNEQKIRKIKKICMYLKWNGENKINNLINKKNFI